jgi:hypothetical protein
LSADGSSRAVRTGLDERRKTKQSRALPRYYVTASKVGGWRLVMAKWAKLLNLSLILRIVGYLHRRQEAASASGR